ncbi:MAG: hypothetical protein ACEQSL_05090 [Sediminibacterium sp.]
MASTITITDVVSQFGQYYIAGGQGQKDIQKRIFAPAETASFFQLIPTSDSVLRGASVEMTEVLQPYQDDFSAKGGATFKPVDIQLFHQKIDWKKNPTIFVESWLGFLASENVDRAQWPFIKYLINELILNKYFEDHELQAIYKGVRDEATGGTAGDAIDAMNGIKFIRNAHIDAGLITPISTGALETGAAAFCTQVEEWFEEINDLYHDSIDYVFMSRTNAVLYRQGKRAKYNVNYMQESDLMSLADHPTVQIKGLRSMSGSDVLWATPKWNRKRAMKTIGTPTTFQIKEYERSVSIYTDWMEGVGFAYPQVVFTNELETNSSS